MDFSRLTQGEKIAGISGVALILIMNRSSIVRRRHSAVVTSRPEASPGHVRADARGVCGAIGFDLHAVDELKLHLKLALGHADNPRLDPRRVFRPLDTRIIDRAPLRNAVSFAARVHEEQPARRKDPKRPSRSVAISRQPDLADKRGR